MSTKYIFVTGGVVSSLGKGITAAALGRLLKSRGLKVANQKLDPYINVDPGKMSPLQHGEVFVTDDGAETDLDLGHYERFTDESLTRSSSVTSGKVYWQVLNRERQGDFMGGPVQVIPHITNEIKDIIMRVGKEKDMDVVITEIGGTVGDIEGLPFLEAIRQMKWEVGQENVLYIHVTLLPYLKMAGEIKTKPTQHSVKELRSIGIQPDILVCRTEYAISQSVKDKLALFCNVKPGAVVQNIDAATLYQVPRLMQEEGLDSLVCKMLGLPDAPADMDDWYAMVDRFLALKEKVTIGLVGKYVDLHDAYLSVAEALTHAGIAKDVAVDIKWIDSGELTGENVSAQLKGLQGIIVPAAFGERGSEGMIQAAHYARVNGIPYFGIGMGLQAAAIEFARNVLFLEGANSTEFDENTAHPVVYSPEGAVDEAGLADSMRLGAYECRLASGTQIAKLYGTDKISERHRNRYEINTAYCEEFNKAGFIPVGIEPKTCMVEAMELEGHPFYIGVLFQPEFKSRPNRAHPLFVGFVEAAKAKKA